MSAVWIDRIAPCCDRPVTTMPSTTMSDSSARYDFIDWAFAYHSTQTRYHHYLLNHTAEVNGDEAHSETYYLFVWHRSRSSQPHHAFGWPLRRPHGAP